MMILRAATRKSVRHFLLTSVAFLPFVLVWRRKMKSGRETLCRKRWSDRESMNTVLSCSDKHPHVYKSHVQHYFWALKLFAIILLQQLCSGAAQMLSLVRITQRWRVKVPPPVCLRTGARVCCRPWRRATSWTWSTSPRGSSPSPSPAAWRSRATPPTCGRSPPCCAPSTDTTTWYAFPVCVREQLAESRAINY